MFPGKNVHKKVIINGQKNAITSMQKSKSFVKRKKSKGKNDAIQAGMQF